MSTGITLLQNAAHQWLQSMIKQQRNSRGSQEVWAQHTRLETLPRTVASTTHHQMAIQRLYSTITWDSGTLSRGNLGNFINICMMQRNNYFSSLLHVKRTTGMDYVRAEDDSTCPTGIGHKWMYYENHGWQEAGEGLEVKCAAVPTSSGNLSSNLCQVQFCNKKLIFLFPQFPRISQPSQREEPELHT